MTSASPTLSAVLVLVVCAWTGLGDWKPKWRLPLDIAANENTGDLAIAKDETTVFTADTRGTIFAVDAKSGSLKWSIPGSGTLDQLFVFPQIPDLVYYSTRDEGASYPAELSLRAVRKADGVEVAKLQNLTTGRWWQPASARVMATRFGLAILHDYGLCSTDKLLNVQWRVDNPLGLDGRWFSHMAVSDSLIATIAHTFDDPPPVEGRALSFDVETGAFLCNVSNVSISPLSLELWNIPFVVTEDGWSFMYRTVGSPDAASLFPRAVNLMRGHCGVYRTDRINSAAIGAFGVTIIPKQTNGSESNLFFGVSRELLRANDTILLGNWTITYSKIGSNDAIWNLTLPANVVNPILTVMAGDFPQPPLALSAAFGIPDAVLLWYLGTLSAIDVLTGGVRWSLAPTTVPTSPPFSVMDPQTVFPLGDGGRLFVPNLLGYTVVETYSGSVLEVNFAEPNVATLQFQDRDTGEAFAVYLDAFGALAGVF